MARAKKKSEQAAEEAVAPEVSEMVEAVETVETVETVEAVEVVAAPEVAEAVEAHETVEAADETPKPEITQDDIRLVEAILFASATAVDERAIAERFPADRAVLIPDILEHLKEQYAGRGVNLVQRDRRWALRTATDLGEQMRLEKEQPRKFTRAAMETMAIIAYHQPVTRAEIENIRGVATSPGALDTLMEAGWIKPGKRREVPGRPVTWLSTQAFLDHFGLERLTDLPGMDELKAAGLLDKRPAIEAMPTSADLFDGDTAREAEDPQEVTDEDLLGGTEDDTVMESSEEGSEEEHGSEGEKEALETEDSDNEDFDDEEDDSDDDEDDDFDDKDEDDGDEEE